MTGAPNDYDTQQLVPVAQIRPASDNLRQELGDLTAMRESVRRVGVLQPLLLVPVDSVLLPEGYGGCRVCGSEIEDGQCVNNGCADYADEPYEVVDGWRRLTCAQLEGLETVPAIIRRMSDVERVEAMLTTALSKKDLAPSEEAAGYARLVELGKSQREIAALAGCTQGHVSKMLAITRLPEKARAAVDSGGITREQAVGLAALPADKVGSLLEGKKPDAYKIDGAIRAHEAAERRRKAEDEAKAQGLKLVDQRDVGYNQNRGAIWLAYFITARRAELPGHDKKSCHAGAWDGREIKLVCTDPASHPRPVEKEEGKVSVREVPADLTDDDRAQLAAKAQWGAERAHLVAEGERCKAFCRALIVKPVQPDVMALAAAMLPVVCDQALEPVLDLLPVDHDDWDLDALSDGLAEWVGDDGRRHVQVIYALALDCGRNFAQIPPGGYGQPEPWEVRLQAAFWAHLTGHGYEMSDLERSWLPEPEVPCAQCGATLGPKSSAGAAAGSELVGGALICVTCDERGPTGIIPADEEPEYEAQVIRQVGVKGDTYTWECGCGTIAEKPFADGALADEDLSSHMVQAHRWETGEVAS